MLLNIIGITGGDFLVHKDQSKAFVFLECRSKNHRGVLL